MAIDLNDYPLYDEIIIPHTGKLSPVWNDFFSSDRQTLKSYLGQYGVIHPSITTAQRDKMNNIKNGQHIYNTTLNVAQYYANGVWVTYP